MAIPVGNVYRMLVYAWEFVEAAPPRQTGGEDGEKLENLLGHVLAFAVETLLRRGIGREYRTETLNIRGIEGRLDVTATIKTLRHVAQETVCEVSRLDIDHPTNRIIKATSRALLKVDGLDPDISARLARCVNRLADVGDSAVRPGDIARTQGHSNNRFERFALRICELIQRSLVPTRSGSLSFADFRDDDEQMNQIFESFLRNFLKVEQAKYSVSRDVLRWDARNATPGAAAWIPSMHTDISLNNEVESMVIDAKFYRDALVERYGKNRFHSHNLYQLYAYLRASRRRVGSGRRVRGALVYPANGTSFDERFIVDDFEIRVKTIDLDAPWSSVHREVLSLALDDAA